ncbi:SGNH/GDSL hydrolase family protein [Curtobacterium sp. RRHDQ10]|uniref:SGNH/GDSL hydrolase family protein n=1 Tax=Curtobacterium phyllosphaerae TaxID=3413379 RepID=UPI003BF3DB0B
MHTRRQRAVVLGVAAAVVAAAAVVGVSLTHGSTIDRAAAGTDRSTRTATTAPHSMSAARPAPTSTAAPARTPAPTPRAADSAPIVDDDTMVTIGDSIMAGYGLDDATVGSWPALVGTATGAPVVNDSCSGAGFIAVGDCGTDFAGLLPTAVAAHPGVLVVQSSDNDLGQDPDELAAATAQTVQSLHAAMPDARIVGLSTLWDQPGTVPAEVAQSSADLQDAVTAVGGTYIDVGQPLVGQDTLLQSDSEHPTDSGQEVLAAAILADLRSAGV